MTTLQWEPAPVPGSIEPPFGWGPKRAWIGLIAGLGTFVAAGVTGLLLIAAFDLNGTSEDIGGPIERASAISEYVHDRAVAIEEGRAIPDPPDDLVADIRTMQTIFGATFGHQILLATVAVLLTGVGWITFRRQVRLGENPLGSIWRPAIGAFLSYIAVAGYGLVTTEIGIDLLIPEGSIPISVTRDPATLAMIGALVIFFAPVAEEFFFRGLLFGGLTRWGFWPAAIVSSLIFAGFHLDTGSMIPFTAVGIVLAWLFWSRKSIWDAIFAHAMFNGASFVLLIIGATL